jgi:hypothetical protein
MFFGSTIPLGAKQIWKTMTPPRSLLLLACAARPLLDD